jgi:hypothetical protein
MPDSTVGMISGEDLQPAFLLEDEHRDVKVKGDTRIPAGVYFIRFAKRNTDLTKKYRNRFPWFTWHLEIVGIKNFTGVYYHIGNKEADTAGCPLIGQTCDLSSGEGTIGRSTIAYEIFYKKVSSWLNAGEDVIVQITDPR